MDPESKQYQDAMDSVVLEEEIDPSYVPSDAEVVEYAKWLGMDLEKDDDLFWIAREGLMAPLPKNWKPCKQNGTEDIYYFNFTTGESTWDHPCDDYYKKLYEENKKKKEKGIKESGDHKRVKAKQDVDQLLGKNKKGKDAKSTSVTSVIPLVSISGGSGGSLMEKKPLPGINLHSKTASPSMHIDLPSPLGSVVMATKSKTSSKLLAAMSTTEVIAEAKHTPDMRYEEHKVDAKSSSSSSAESSLMSSQRKSFSGGSFREDSAVVEPMIAKKSHSVIAESKEGRDTANDFVSGGSLAPLVRSKPLPVLTSSSHESSRTMETSSASSIDNNASQHSKTESIIQELRAELRQEQEKCKDLQDSLRKMQQNIAEIESSSSQAVKNAELATEQAKSEVASLEFSLRKANNYVADKNAAVAQVNTEMEKRDKDIQSLVADRSGLQSQLAGLSREITRLNEDLQAKSQEVVEIKSELTALKETERNARRACEEAEDTVRLEKEKFVRLDTGLSQTLATLRQKNSDLEVSLAVATKNISSSSSSSFGSSSEHPATTEILNLQQTVTTQKTDNERLAFEISQRDKIIASLNLDCTRLRAEMDLMITEAKSVKDTLQNCESKLKSAEHMCEALKLKLTQSNMHMYDEQQVQSLKLMDDLKSETSTLKSEMSTLKTQKAVADAENVELLRRIERLTTELQLSKSSVVDTFQSAKSQTDIFDSHIGLQKEIAVLTSRLAQYELERQDSDKQIEHLTASRDTAQTAVASAMLTLAAKAQHEAVLSDALSGTASLKEEIKRYEREVTALQADAKQANETLSAEREKRMLVDAELQSYRQKLHVLEQSIDMKTAPEKTIISVAVQTDTMVSNLDEKVSEEKFDINADLEALKSAVVVKETMIQQLSSQLNDMRSQLAQSVVSSTSHIQNQYSAEAQSTINDLRRDISVQGMQLSREEIRRQMTEKQLAESEEQVQKYKQNWIESQTKNADATLDNQRAMRQFEDTLREEQRKVSGLNRLVETMRHDATLSETKIGALREDLSDMRLRCESQDATILTLKNEIEVLNRAKQSTLVVREDSTVQEKVGHPPALLSVAPVVSTENSATVGTAAGNSSSIVELSIALGRQQADMMRLEQRLQQINSTRSDHQKREHNPLSAPQPRQFSKPQTDTIKSSESDSIGDIFGNEVFRSSDRRTVKFDQQAASPPRRKKANQRKSDQHHQVRLGEDDSGSDFTLLSMLQSPVATIDEIITPIHVAQRIESTSSKIGVLVKRNGYYSDAVAQETVYNMQCSIVADVKIILVDMKRDVRIRSEKILKLKDQWKMGQQRGGASSSSSSSSQAINQQTGDVNQLIKKCQEFKRCAQELDKKVHIIHTLTADHHNTNASIQLQREFSSAVKYIVEMIRDYVAATDTAVPNLKGYGKMVRDNSYSVDDRCVYYGDKAKRESNFGYDSGSAMFNYHDGVNRDYKVNRRPLLSASTVEFPRSSNLNERRLFAQKCITKIDKAQIDTYRECEKHVQFLSKITKELATATQSKNATVMDADKFLSARTDRENKASYSNMLLSGGIDIFPTGTPKCYDI